MRPSHCILSIAILGCSSTGCAAFTTIVRDFRLATCLSFPVASNNRRGFSLLSLAANDAVNETTQPPEEEQDDTIRVRIWRTLASGKETSLKELGVAVGERRLGDLKSHLQHVEKQAKTLKNKNDEWRKRRGLPSTTDTRNLKKLRIKTRRGKNNDILVRLG